MSSTAARWLAWRRAGERRTDGAALSPITYPTTPLRTLVEIAPGADLTADPSTWTWVDITGWVRHDLGISTSVGRRDQSTIVDSSRATLKLDNRDGRFSRRNPTGPYYGQLTRNTPIRMGVNPGSGVAYRYHGFVNEWPLRWDRSGNDAVVTIACGGQLRRLARSIPLRPALERATLAANPAAYWTLQDGTDAAFAASALSGGSRGVLTGNASFGASLVPAGGTGAVNPTGGGFAGATGIAQGTSTGWEMQCVVGWDTLPTPFGTGFGPTVTACSTPGGTIVEWGIQLREGFANDFYLAYYYCDSSGGGGGLSDLGLDPIEAGRTYHFRVTLAQSGADVIVHVYRDGVQAPSTDTLTSTTLYAPTKVVPPHFLSTGTKPTSLSHVAVWSSVRSTDAIGGAADGYTGEQAHERIMRLCREEGIPVRCVSGRSAALGPQPTTGLLEAMRDAERADLGVLYEHEFGIGYRTISEYYNQPAALALDFDQGHVGDPPEADDSDQRFRNQWTVSRDDGASALYRDPGYSTAVGLYEGSTTANVETDDQTEQLASWLVHRDTVDEDYWTGLKLRFGRSPDLIPAWTALPFGSRMTAVNQPAQADPSGIDAIVEGWSERWDTVVWEATLNTSPASTYRVGVLDDPVLGRLDSATSVLAADVASGATSLSVDSTATGDLWSTSASDYPQDILIGGEAMTLTAVAGGSSPQTFTVTRSVNGVVKTHSAGAALHLKNPFRLSL